METCSDADTPNKQLSLTYNPGKHYPALDGLRGLAFLLVFTVHAVPYVQIFRLGWVGVDLFFVLSGFLITGILIDSKFKPYYYRNFISRRALRIFPLYYFFIFISILILPRVFPSIFTDFSYYLDHQTWYWLYGSNWLRSMQGDNSNKFLHHLWSLSVEEQFYVFWPLVVFSVPTRYLVQISLILIGFAIVFRYTGSFLFGFVFPFQYINTLARMDSLLIGAIIATLYRLKPILLTRLTFPVLWSSGAFLVMLIVYHRKLGFSDLADTFTFWDLFFGAMLVISISDTRNSVNALLNTRFFKFFGKYSYGLYVYHLPVYQLLIDKVQSPLHLHFRFDGILMTLLCMGLSILIALASFYCIEKPFLKLKKYFEPPVNLATIRL